MIDLTDKSFIKRSPLIKKAVFALIAVSALLIMSGCGPSREEVIEHALNSLEAKYGEKFVCYRYYGPRLLSLNNTYSMWMHPESDEDKVFIANRQKGSKAVYDTYLLVLLKPEIEERIHSIIGKYYDDYKIQIIFSGSGFANVFPNEYGAGTTFEDLSRDGYAVRISMYIYVDASVYNANDFRQMADELLNYNPGILARLYTVLPEYYKDLTPETVFDDYGYGGEWYNSKEYSN